MRLVSGFMARVWPIMPGRSIGWVTSVTFFPRNPGGIIRGSDADENDRSFAEKTVVVTCGETRASTT